LPLADLLRQSVFCRLAGYEDVNDAERLSKDPTFRAAKDLTRRLLGGMLRRIATLPSPAG